MIKILFQLLLVLFPGFLFSQSTEQKLQQAFRAFESDPQLKHAAISLLVVDAKTGKPVFRKNEMLGLAPASTLKVITSATALAILGPSYRYQTMMGYSGELRGEVLEGDIIFRAQGDPSLGSWRWSHSRDTVLMKEWARAIRQAGIREIDGSILLDNRYFETNAYPGGWPWEDLGQYYGAGAHGFNWRENQYDVYLRSGSKPGDPVEVIRTDPGIYFPLQSELVSAKAGSGDNAYLFMPLGMGQAVVRGTIPVNEKNFRITGAFPDPFPQFLKEWSPFLEREGIRVNNRKNPARKDGEFQSVYTHRSSSMDSLVHFFNQRSINLYGEALLKTLSYEKYGKGILDSGIAILQRFWESQGLGKYELKLYDGSGLSPGNRVTTSSQVLALQYARRQEWFPAYYNSLPTYNGMKLKSGTIGGVKGFAGYHKSTTGREFTISFLVNNYNGSASELVRKMYRVLDALK